jgi:hypothetical protein
MYMYVLRFDKFFTKVALVMVAIRLIVTRVTMATTVVMDNTGFYGGCTSSLALMSSALLALSPILGHCKVRVCGGLHVTKFTTNFIKICPAILDLKYEEGQTAVHSYPSCGLYMHIT